jgi:hypothetical protein
MRVSEDGGTPESFTHADASKGERRLADPHFMPDGQSLLYTIVTVDSNEGQIAAERDGVRKLLGQGDASAEPVWSPTGHVFFTRHTGIDSALWALPFSLVSMSSTGKPFRIAAGGGGASVAADGSLVYGLRRPVPQALVRVDRTGRVLGVIAESRAVVSEPKLSPDGRMLLAGMNFGGISVWETDRGVETRITGDDEGGCTAYGCGGTLRKSPTREPARPAGRGSGGRTGAERRDNFLVGGRCRQTSRATASTSCITSSIPRPDVISGSRRWTNPATGPSFCARRPTKPVLEFLLTESSSHINLMPRAGGRST